MGLLEWSRSAARAILLLCPFLFNAFPSAAEGVMFTLRPNSILARKPDYKAAERLDLMADAVVVEGPSLEQNGDFCLNLIQG